MAANAAEVSRILNRCPPTLKAISGNALFSSDSSLKPETSGNSDWVNQAETKKMPPPISSASTIAFGTVEESLASSVYIVIASKPMKEKATMVAPVMTRLRWTPSCHSGWVEKMVPLPIPSIRDLAARIRNTAIRTTSKTTSSMFTREVLVMLNRHIAVIAAT